MKVKQQHLPSLDGLKGISIIAIVLYHVFPQLFSGGFLWVNTFFVIGGFFLARQIESYAQTHTEKNFLQLILKTVYRLWIPLVGFFACCLSVLLFLDPTELKYNLWDVLSSLFFFNNFYQILSEKSYFTQAGGSSPFTHLWYTALYLQAYLIGILGIRFTQKLNLRAIPKAAVWLTMATISHILMAICYIPNQDPSRVYYGIDTRLASFAIGIALAYLLPMILNSFAANQHKEFLYTLSTIPVLGALLIMTLSIHSDQAFTYVLWMPLFSYLSAYLVFLCVIGTPLTHIVLAQPPLSYLGQRSYSFYLWYYPIVHYLLMAPLSWLNCLVALLLWLVIGQWHYLIWEQGGRSLVIFKDWLSSTNWQAHLHMFKQKQWQPRRILQLVLILCLVLLTGCGASQLAQNKRLGQFEIEYLNYKNHPNMSGAAFPNSQLILHNQAVLDPVYKGFQIEKPQTTQNINTWLSKLLDPLGLSDPSSQMNVNRDLLVQFYENAPDMAQLLKAHEIAFAQTLPITLFGDSVALLNSANFETLFPKATTFGEVSLSVYNWGLDRLQAQLASGQMQDNVVLQIGTNGGLTEADIDTLVDMLGDRQIFFMTIHNGDTDDAIVNAAIQSRANKYENVHVLDWASYASGHDADWFISDGVHENDTGSAQYVAFIGREIYRILHH